MRARMQVSAIHDEADPAFKLKFFTLSPTSVRRRQRPRRPKRVLLNFGAHHRAVTPEVARQLALVLCGEAPSRFYGWSSARGCGSTSCSPTSEVMVVPAQYPSPASRMLAERASGA